MWSLVQSCCNLVVQPLDDIAAILGDPHELIIVIMAHLSIE